MNEKIQLSRYNSEHNKMLFSPNTLFVLFSNFTFSTANEP